MNMIHNSEKLETGVLALKSFYSGHGTVGLQDR